MSSDIPANIAVLTCPVLFGDLVNWGLFGGLTVQVYLYYMSFPKDRTLIKTVVYVTYIIEVLQTALATREAFRILGTGWGNPEVLLVVGWLGVSINILVSILTWISQTFYAWRIYVLRKKLWIPVPIAVLSLIGMICGTISGARIQELGILSKVESHTYKSTTVRLVCSLVCDVIIAGSMLEFLYGSRAKLLRTQNIVSRLIRLVFETGLILLCVAIIDLTFFLTFPQNNYFYAPAMTLSKLYSNTMLVMLNARIEVVGGRYEPRRGEVEMSDFAYSLPVANIPASQQTAASSTNDVSAAPKSKPVMNLVTSAPRSASIVLGSPTR